MTVYLYAQSQDATRPLGHADVATPLDALSLRASFVLADGEAFFVSSTILDGGTLTETRRIALSPRSHLEWIVSTKRRVSAIYAAINSARRQRAQGGEP